MRNFNIIILAFAINAFIGPVVGFIVLPQSETLSYNNYHPMNQIRRRKLFSGEQLLLFEKINKLTDAEKIDTTQTKTTDRFDTIDPMVVSKFKIVTCSATSCAAKRKKLLLEPYATFAGFYDKIQQHKNNNDSVLQHVQIEECSCLGSCKLAPCVALEHDDYDGPVAVIGMNPTEFTNRVFNTVIDSNDIDRVWSCFEDAVVAMAEAEAEE